MVTLVTPSPFFARHQASGARAARTRQRSDFVQRRARQETGRYEVTAVPSGGVRVFERDPELIEHLSAERRRTAMRLFAESWTLRRGVWNPEGNPPAGQLDYGMLILEGLMLCRCSVGRRASVELLGGGDLINTVEAAAVRHESIERQASWQVLAPARVALLDAEFIARAGMLPGVLARLHARSLWRVRSLTFRLAVTQVPQLTNRVQLLLWHLADRWGYRRADDVVIPYRISQQVIAECVSAQRTSVSTALKRLSEEGTVQRSEDGFWTLHQEPPGLA